MIADSTYHQIARVSAVNGYAADLHDMTITPEDTALITIYNPVIVDASSVKGAKKQRVLEPVIQDIDIATGTLLFEWHGLSSIPLKDSYQPVPKKAAAPTTTCTPTRSQCGRRQPAPVGPPHVDRVQDRSASGVLDWTLGGKKDNFAIAKNAETAWQHDARPNPDGTLTIFDNGSAGPTVTHKTRGLVLRLDEQAMTATLVPPVPRTRQGRVDEPRQLPPPAQRRLLRRVGRPTRDHRVRSRRHDRLRRQAPQLLEWQHHVLPGSAVAVDRPPTDLPAVAVRRGSGDEMTVYASWNGATDVARGRCSQGLTMRISRRSRRSPKMGSRPRSSHQQPALLRGPGARRRRHGVGDLAPS